MNVRLKKEFHSLFWPWLVALSAALLPLIDALLKAVGAGGKGDPLTFVSMLAYFLIVVLCGVLPFGIEFQHRSMQFLLSQPCSRRSLWREKVTVSIALLATVAIAHLLGLLVHFSYLRENWLLGISMTLLLYSTSLFWTLATRTILGGIVLSLMTLAITYLLTFAFTDPAFYTAGSLEFRQHTAALQTLISLAATPLFLWLSWYKFDRLELSGHGDQENAISLTGSAGGTDNFRVHSHAARPTWNLILKELRLLKPVFVTMALFSGLWLSAIFLAWLMPAKKMLFTDIIDGFSSLYVPLIILLSGILSLGEEKSLGIHTCNLTSPVSAGWQWFVKNTIACLTGLTGTLVLFVVMSMLTGRELDLTPSRIFLESGRFIFSVWLFLFMLIQVSFWASTVAQRTIHAFFLAAVTIIVFATLLNLSIWVGKHAAGLIQKPVYSLVAARQWSQWGVLNGLVYLSGVTYLVACATLIISGFNCFRLIQSEKVSFLQSVKIPVIVLSSAGLIIGAIEGNMADQNFAKSFLYQETKAVIMSLKKDAITASNFEPFEISPAELSTAENLSPQTRAWLQNSSVYVTTSYDRSKLCVVAFVNLANKDKTQMISFTEETSKPRRSVK